VAPLLPSLHSMSSSTNVKFVSMCIFV
jgi:hypothetical protein